LSELEFRRSLHIVTRQKPSEGRADAIEYAIGFSILLLLGELQSPQVIRRDMVRRSLEDRIDVFVTRLLFSQRDVDVGTVQMRRNIFGIDLERLVEEPHGAFLIAPAAEHLALDMKRFGRARVGSNRFVYQLVGFGRVCSGQQTSQL